jgi:hypothetical protein
MSGIELLPRIDPRAPEPREPASVPRPPAPPILPQPDSASRRVRRNRSIAVVLLVLGLAFGLSAGLRGGGGTHAARVIKPRPRPRPRPHHAPKLNPRLNPDWDGDGQAVTFAFGGDVNFPSGSLLGERLASDPSGALGTGAPQLLSGVDLSMVNFESALTNGSCPQPQPKQYVFYAPAAAVTAFQSAGVSLVTEANNHGEDCGPTGLQMALTIRSQTKYTILGIGQDAAQAFTPYQTVIHGERVGIIAATQVIDGDLQTAWTATGTQPGLASAYDVNALVAAVEAARKVDDTVIVFLHWGVELDPCPDPLQEPLANVLVKAGADIVIGSHAHVLLGGGYLGSAYVDYGLGNFAFYNDPYPTDESGSLVITATGRHIDNVTWRPALLEDELPVPLSGAAAVQALQTWNQARSCTDVTADPQSPLATRSSEESPAPASIARTLSVDS